jgi:hypothetical protein
MKPAQRRTGTTEAAIRKIFARGETGTLKRYSELTGIPAECIRATLLRLESIGVAQRSGTTKVPYIQRGGVNVHYIEANIWGPGPEFEKQGSQAIVNTAIKAMAGYPAWLGGQGMGT